VIAPEEGLGRHFLSRPRSTKAFQSKKTEPVKDFVVEPQMIENAVLLEFHAAEPHANPGVQAVKRPTGSEEPRRKVLSRAPNDSVEFIHQNRIEVMLAASQFPNLVFEFLHGLGPHTAGTAGEDKPQKGVTLPIGGHFRFLRAQMKLEPLFEHVLDKRQCLFSRLV
jgi:hypothetical protein